MRLGWGGPLLGYIGLGHRALLDGKQRLAVIAPEYEHRAHLGNLRHRLDDLTLPANLDQGRLGRQVVVKNIVMNQLLMPDRFAVGTIQYHQGIRVGNGVQPVAAVGVGAGATEGNEHPVARHIDA